MAYHAFNNARPYWRQTIASQVRGKHALATSVKHTLIGSFLCLLSVLPGGVALGAPWNTVVFEDDFGMGEIGGLPNAKKWIVNVPETWWWTQGRTFDPSPVYHSSATFPRVISGECLFEHHSYNPYDLAHWTFLGGQIRTQEQFPASTAYRFEAVVRCGVFPSGVVTSFFTYGFDGVNSDEIDFEFVSKKNYEDHRSDGDWVLTNSWNESMQKPLWVWVPGLDLAQWNRFRIYWYPGQRVDWTWLVNPEDEATEVLLRTETDSLYIPDQPMGVYSNIWAADANWPEAYSSQLQPVSVPEIDQVLTFTLDDVLVSTPEPVSAALLAVGLLAIGCRSKHGR